MDILKDIPSSMMPLELWRALALCMIGLLVFVVNRYLAAMNESNKEMKESNKEFQKTLLKLSINDAVQDERLDSLEEKGKLVKYRK